ncbi:MAG: nucleotidyltransferase domain-containing protein [Candidatus Competibacteraceae bacterium]|nr:nucleotidyltransferase domain-containing protein [Candidatus Competibacteraceae bacterium]HRY15422.1 nucleotidyltransferase domain-containing protein [Candidatus Competibacteraceae bacterium]
MNHLAPADALTATIRERLAAIERTHAVRILYACESGSRAWGFASPDSDYDVRFIYVRPRDEYLCIDLERRRDVIECPIEGVFDINGWDWRKALQLMCKGNPPLFEWLHSPLVYRAQPGFQAAMQTVIPRYYAPLSCAWHYLHMARGNDREYLQGDRVRLKKYLYVLRPLLAVNWLESGRGIVPMRFYTLVETLIPPGALRGAMDHLLQLKQGGEELAWGPRLPALNDWIEAELARLAHGPALAPVDHPGSKPLNALFRAWLPDDVAPHAS